MSDESANALGTVARWRLMLLATKDPDVTKADLAVLGAVLDRMGKKGEAFPGLATIASDALVNHSTAARSIGRLDELGYLLRESGHATRSLNRYALGQGRCGVAPRTRRKPAPSDPIPTRCRPEDSLGASGTDLLGAALHHKSDKSNQKEQSGKEGAARPEYQLFENGLQFLKKSGSQETAARKILGMLRKSLGDPEAARLVAEAERQSISDPIPWLIAAMHRARSSVAQSFADKTYTGTPENELPTHLRD
jgi:hypothetical protein